MELSEEIIIVAKNGRNIGEYDMLDCLNFLAKVKNKPEYITWLVSNLHLFQEPISREFALGDILSNLKSWVHVPEQLYPSLIQEFFIDIFNDENYGLVEYEPVILHIGCVLCHTLYHQFWDIIYQSILSYPNSRFFNFVNYFGLSMSENYMIYQRDIPEFQQFLLINGAQVTLLQKTLNEIINQTDRASKSLSSLINWIDLSLFLDNEILQLIVTLLNQPNTMVDAIITLKSVFSRKTIPIDVLCDILKGFNFKDIFENIAEGNWENNVFIEISSLIETIVIPISSYPIVQDFISPVLTLYLKDDPKVTFSMNKVIYELLNYYSSDENLLSTLLNLVIEKLFKTVGLGLEQADLILGHALALLMRIQSYTRVSLIEYLSQFFDKIDTNNVQLCATFLTALNPLLERLEGNKEIRMFISDKFVPVIMKINPDPSSYRAISALSVIVYPLLQDSDPTLIVQFFLILCQIMLNGQVPLTNSFKREIEEMIVKISQNFPEILGQFPEVHQMSHSLVGCMDDKLVESSSYIIALFDHEERVLLYSEIISMFYSRLNGLKPQEACSLIIKFMQHMNLEGCESIKDQFFEFTAFFRNFIPHSSLGKYIKLMIDLCGLDCLAQIWPDLLKSKFDDNTEIEALITLTQLMNEYQGPELLDFITLLTKTCVKQERNVFTRHIQSVEVYYSYYNNLIIFLLNKISLVPQELFNSVFSTIFNSFLIAASLPNDYKGECITLFLQHPELIANSHYTKRLFLNFISELRVVSSIYSVPPFMLDFVNLLRMMRGFIDYEDIQLMSINMEDVGIELLQNFINCEDENVEEHFKYFVEIMVGRKRSKIQQEELGDDESMEEEDQ